MATNNLSQKQAAVYSFLVRRLRDGLPPTIREICRATGIKSTSTVHGILDFLEENGYITRDSRSSRSIRIANTQGAVQVPVLGRVTAGNPILAVEDIIGYIPFLTDGSDPDGLFALKVEGLSMRDAGILDGDIVIADKNRRVTSGDIVIALIGGEEATVKRLIIEGNRPILMPENPDYSPIYPNELKILGKVVASFRKY
ncbi:MAG TPA: transcriptional repressor LexA [Clostridiales bacterium]|nr:transcriptional repressor LexA [Clostridiales bacterium]